MTSSPDLIHELKASRPAAPTALRARVREIATKQEVSRTPWPRLRLPARRVGLVAFPAAAALALASAAVLGLARSDSTTEAFRDRTAPLTTNDTLESVPAPGAVPDTSTGKVAPGQTLGGPQGSGSAIGPTDNRAQRVSATLTVEVSDSDAVSRAAQDALDLTRRLGGHVVSASVATGDEGSAALMVRVPVGKVQEAIVGLSALGRIVSQQVTIDDLQESLDAMERRERSVREQLARISARLESEPLDAQTRAVLEARRQTLRTEHRELRRGIASTNAEARMATIQLNVVTPGTLGAVPTPTRLDRTLDEALNVLVWEGVVVLAAVIIAAPFALVAFAAWLGRRFYRRREEDRLLAAPGS
jgi:uncharacterized protein DUF4349